MCAKNHLLIFSSFLEIWENVEWPRFFGPPCNFLKDKMDIHGLTVIHADGTTLQDAINGMTLQAMRRDDGVRKSDK